MRCAICYNLYNFKNVKNTHGGVLVLVKLQGLSVLCLINKITDFDIMYLRGTARIWYCRLLE